MKKLLLMAALTLVSAHAYASDDDTTTCAGTKVFAAAQEKANNFAQDLGYSSPKRVGQMFFSHNQNALIVLIRNADNLKQKTLHIAIPVNADSCTIRGAAHE